LSRRSTISTSHHSKISTNVSSIGHKEVMDQAWTIYKIIKTNVMILLVGLLQITKVSHVPSIHMSLLEKVFVLNQVYSKLISTPMLDGGIMNQNITAVLAGKVDLRQQLKLPRNGTYVIMDIMT
jgi:hypothetical protein